MAGEGRALEVLRRRTARPKATAELLVHERTIEGEALDQALGKAPAGAGGPAEPPEG
jgi:hypothetical protein